MVKVTIKTLSYFFFPHKKLSPRLLTPFEDTCLNMPQKHCKVDVLSVSRSSKHKMFFLGLLDCFAPETVKG